MPYKRDENSWKLIFDGNLLRPNDRDVARRKFAERFASDPEQLDRIFSGKPIVLRRDLGHRSAKRIQADLQALGMRCRVVGRKEQKASAANRAAAATGVYSDRDIDAAFSGDFIRPRAGLIYRLSLLCVAALMVLLPVLYVALVGAVAYGIYWYASGNLPLFIDPAAQTLALLGHGVATVAGGVLLLFLLKPFCARRRGMQAPVVLDPLRQPVLFRFVEQITARVGAAMPSEIRVNANVNASASLRRGVFSRELTLTIGMPLFLGMDVQTLGGILTHEFGHFAQHTGIRLRSLIEHINRWFYRRAYEPDSWDRFVQGLSDSRNPFVRLVGLVSRAGIWVSRRILILLAMFASLCSRYMSRQMEYDADRYEINMIGSEQFRDTAVRLRVLATCFQTATQEARMTWRDNQLPNDLPTLAMHHADALGPEELARIAASITKRNADLTDTHPPDRERIAAAQAMQRPGVLAHTGPARRLLHRCDELCRKVTFAWYRDQGYSFTSRNLVALDIVHSELTRQDEQYEALRRYLGGSFIDHRVLPMPSLHKLLGTDVTRLRGALRAWREPLDAAATASLAKRYADAFERLLRLSTAETLSRLGLPFNHAQFGAESADTATILDQARSARDDLEAVESKLGVQDRALAKRFAVSLALGCRSGLLRLEDIDHSVVALRALGQVCEQTIDIVRLERSLRSLMDRADENADNAQIDNAISEALVEYQRWLDRVNNTLIHVPNPLRPGTHLGEAVWQWTPDREYVVDNPAAAAQTLAGIVDAVRFLNVRITARLAEHAERVESTLGA